MVKLYIGASVHTKGEAKTSAKTNKERDAQKRGKMFGFGKKKKKQGQAEQARAKLDKTDYENPIYQKGLKWIGTMRKEDLKDNKIYAMTLVSTQEKGMDQFFNMLRDMSDEEYNEWLEEVLH